MIAKPPTPEETKTAALGTNEGELLKQLISAMSDQQAGKLAREVIVALATLKIMMGVDHMKEFRVTNWLVNKLHPVTSTKKED